MARIGGEILHKVEGIESQREAELGRLEAGSGMVSGEPRSDRMGRELQESRHG
jgi:hypothetical protein